MKIRKKKGRTPKRLRSGPKQKRKSIFLLQQAKGYVKQNFYLFPATFKNDNYKPLTKWKYDPDGSSNSLKQIRKWHEKWPKAIFCVNLIRSGIWVLDVDCKPGKSNGHKALRKWLKSIGRKLPKTLVVETPNKGTHIFFRGIKKPARAQFDGPIDVPEMVPLPGISVPGKGEYKIKHDRDIAKMPKFIQTMPKGVVKAELPEESLWDGNLSSLNLPNTILDYIKNGKPRGERSEAAHAVISTLIECGLTHGEIVQCVASNAIGERYKGYPGKLEDEIDRIAAKNQSINEFDTHTGKPHKYSPAWFNERCCIMMIGGNGYVLERSKRPNGNEYYYRVRMSEYEKFHKNRKIFIDGKPVNAASHWLKQENRRECYPDRFITDDTLPVGPTENGAFNEWEGLAIKPKKGEKHKLFKKLVRAQCGGDKKYAEYALKWYAHLIQFPTVRHEKALVFMGEQGTGKSTINTILRTILGDHAKKVEGDTELKRWNGELKGKVFAYAEEVKLKDKEGTGKLKTLITDPFIVYEKKSERGIIESPNYISLIISTNDKWAVNLSANDERRFAVFNASNKFRGDNNAIWKKIYRTDKRTDLVSGHFDPEFLQNTVYYLLHKDISNFDPRNAPVTSGLVDQKLRSLSYGERWWWNCIETGRFPGDIITSDEWSERGCDIDKTIAFGDFRESIPYGSITLMRDLTKIFKKFGIKIKQVRKKGKHIRVYRIPKQSEAKKLFLNVLKGKA